MKILLTTTSFQDTPGPHHDLLARSGFEVVRARGPLSEAQMLELISENDGFDAFRTGLVEESNAGAFRFVTGGHEGISAKWKIGANQIVFAG